MKSLKTVTLAGLLAAGSFSHVSAAPAVAIADSATLFVNSSAEMVWQSNIFRDEDGVSLAAQPGQTVQVQREEVDALAFIFSPGLELQFADNRALEAGIYANVDIIRYSDIDGDVITSGSLDDEFVNVGGEVLFDNGKLDLRASFDFSERPSNTLKIDEDIFTDPDANLEAVVLEIEHFNAKTSARYRVSDLFSLRAGVAYDRRGYPDNAVVGYERISVPLTALYELSPKVDAFINYTYRTTELKDVPSVLADIPGANGIGYVSDYSDNLVKVGLEGELFVPSLVGEASIGWITRENEDPIFARSADVATLIDGDPNNDVQPIDSERDSVALSASVRYSPPQLPKLQTSLRLTNDFRTSTAGDSIEELSGVLSAQYNISTAWAVSTTGLYSSTDYEVLDREEQRFLLSGAGVYSPNDYLTLVARYTYDDVSGDKSLSREYKNHTLSVTASLRY